MAYLKRELISHSRKVCSLYKRMSRDIEYHEDDFWEARYKKLVLRAEFDKNKDIKDIRLGKALLEKGEAKFFKEIHIYHAHAQPELPFSKEGIAYGRHLESPDYVMDYYNPLEKAQYPYYYAKREAMKEEYLKLWRKKVYNENVDNEKNSEEQTKS